MDVAKPRAVVVALRGEWLLVIRRMKDGRRYAVLPGGGVEPDELAQDAALRELAEETGLSGEVSGLLWSLEHPDRRADYFSVAVPVSPMTMRGPELRGISTENTYEPCWIRVLDVERENLQPASIRDLLRDLARASGETAVPSASAADRSGAP